MKNMSDNKSIWQQTDCFSFWHYTHHTATTDWHHRVQDYSKSTAGRSCVSCDCPFATEILPFMKFCAAQLAPSHLYPQILFPAPSLAQNETPCFHRTNIRTLYVLVEERREQLCIKPDRASYIKESYNSVPATALESSVPSEKAAAASTVILSGLRQYICSDSQHHN